MTIRKYLPIIILVALTVISVKAKGAENIPVNILLNGIGTAKAVTNILSFDCNSEEVKIGRTGSNVTSPTVFITFKKVEDGESIVSGKRYMIVANSEGEYYAALLNESSSKDLRSEKVSLDNGMFTITDLNFAFTFEGSDKCGFTIKQSDGSYLVNVNSATAITRTTSQNYVKKYGIWKVSTSDGSTKIQNTNSKRFFIFYRNSTHPVNDKIFVAYQTSSSKYVKPLLYEEVDSGVTVSVSSVEYATLYYSNIALKVPEGVTATTYAYDETTKNLMVSKTYEAGSTIPKGVAVVLHAAEGSYTFTASNEVEQAPKSNLYGYDVNATTYVDGMSKYYMLSLKANNDANSVGFYWGEDNGGGFTTSAHKAFLALPASATAKGFAFEDVVDGISSMSKTDDQSGDPVYSLTGVRMIGKLPAGIYVSKGKKFIVR